jgi:hypothetical protein
MIAYVDKPPTIEPCDGGFLVTFTSGGSETQFLLTLHAMTGLCGKGMRRVQEAQCAATEFAPTPFTPKQRRPKC